MKTNRRILQKDKTMLRVFLIFFFSLSYFSYPQEEGTPANLQQYDLKGAVKSVETIAKPIGEKDSVKYHGLSTYKSSQVFNIYGLLVEENENFDETENDSKILCYYNAKHKLTQKITFKHSDKLAEMRRYSYDTLGQIIKYEFYGKDTTYLISSKYFYYLDTKLIKSIDSSFGTGVLTDFIYDEYGNLAEKRRYDEDGKLDFSNSYNYDERGNLVKHNLLTVDYQKDQIRTYTYDKSNRVIERTLIDDSDYMHFRWVNEYNTKGKKIRDAQYEFDKLTSEDIYSYNIKGELIKIEEFDGNKSLYKTITFKYDNTGNWIIKITSFADGIIETQLRTIVYF